jgi:uncharacterized integral membrane protein
MQLMLILGIVFASGAVIFALQNTAIVAVSLAAWQVEGSLALVLLITLGLGVLIAGLISSPAMISRQWATVRLRRQVVDLERDILQYQKTINDLNAEIARLTPDRVSTKPEPEKPYVGFREMIAGE